jgi:prepilin-type N-terminal cleavage/methylation domain-containing protein
MRRNSPVKKGFTLAELLISLAILGVIATFTIPKILSTQGDSRFKAVAKENVATVAAAYQAYSLSNEITGNETFSAFTPYMNYVALDSSSTIDATEGNGSVACFGDYRCLRMHNGSMIRYRHASGSFNGTNTTNAIWFYVEPDGVYSGTTNGPGKSAQFFLYTNGRIVDSGNMLPNTCNSEHCPFTAVEQGAVPAWFSWD